MDGAEERVVLQTPYLVLSREATYSRPLSYLGFTKDSLTVDGEVRRVAPRLVFGGDAGACIANVDGKGGLARLHIYQNGAAAGELQRIADEIEQDLTQAACISGKGRYGP